MSSKLKGMKKNLTNYGDNEFSIFLRKAFIKGLGYSDEMLEKPIIGITNTYSDYNPCHGNVSDLVKSVKINREPRGWEKASDHTPVTITLEN